MSKNIEMNIKTESGYEVLYPKSTPEQVGCTTQAWIEEYVSSNYLNLSGGTMTGSINMGGQKISGVGAPSEDGDVLRLGDVGQVVGKWENIGVLNFGQVGENITFQYNINSDVPRALMFEVDYQGTGLLDIKDNKNNRSFIILNNSVAGTYYFIGEVRSENRVADSIYYNFPGETYYLETYFTSNNSFAGDIITSGKSYPLTINVYVQR